MKIHQCLTSPEGKTLEFKRDVSGLKQIMKTIVTFANTAGGVIVIGREDHGDITGVDGKSLLCIRVAHWPPFYLKSEGGRKGIKDRKYFYEAYLNSSLQAGFIEYTIPEKPKSKLQQYRLTQRGMQQLENLKKKT